MSSIAPQPALPSRRLTLARALAILAMCMVPVSTALTNVFCALFALAVLSAPECWRGLPALPRQGAALAALLLLAALAASVAWSVAPVHDGWQWVAKYDKLLLLPFAVLAFRDAAPSWAAIARWSLFATLVAVLLLATSNFLGLSRIGPLYEAGLPTSRAWVFKNHIAAGMFGALLFYQAADLMLAARAARARIALGAIAALGLLYVYVMLQGRTGQVIGLLLVAVIAWRVLGRLRRRSPKLAAAAALLFVLATLAGAGLVLTRHDSRLMQVAGEVQAYRQTDAATSSGLRLAWYQRALGLYAERPLVGYGVAGLGVEFKRLAAGKTLAEARLTENPHNEYLLMAVQLGTLGLALFINLLVQAWRASRSLDARSRHLLLAWLTIFTIGCGANSLLLDFSEGHLFVLLAGILIGCGYRSEGAPRTALERA
ncbi:O-antigen ligase [Burkholderia gladioli]|uniref:O-antigen ligase family protein n=1 Tax=Burkholderia gladioli TaxID=28095 RepID=UPI00163E634D|nr:O-antigen ligase family protein [Burkholderia gladioli]